MEESESKEVARQTDSLPTKTENTTLVPRDDDQNKDDTFCCGLDKRLTFNKGFYMSFQGALGCVLPYWAIYFKQLGFSPQQIGIIFGLRPIAGFISAPVWGMIADRFRIRRLLFMISIMAWILMIVAVIVLPPPERTDSCPRRLIPHRGHRHHHHQPAAVTIATANVTEAADVDPSLHLTPEQVDVLREDISWVYKEWQVDRLLVIVGLLVLGGELVQSPTGTFADASTLHCLGESGRGRYGAHRAWGAIGWGLGSFVTGALLSQSRQPEVVCGIKLHFSDYHNCLYAFLIIIGFGVISATQIEFEDKDKNPKHDKEAEEEEEEGEKTKKKPLDDSTTSQSQLSQEGADKKAEKPATGHSALAVLRIFGSLHYGSWLLTVLFAGMCNGCIWGFLFWHLENLGADQLLMGVSNFVTCTSEFVMFFVADFIIKRIGHIQVFYIGFLCYIARLLMYSELVNPWWVVGVEVLQGWTFSCMIVSMATYAAEAVPAESLATIQGIFHGVYFGVGVGSGKLMAGLLIGSYGAVVTFQIYAACCAVVLVLFAIAQKCSPRPETRQLFYEKMTGEEEKSKQ